MGQKKATSLRMKRLAQALVLVLSFLATSTLATQAQAGEPEPLHRYSDDRLPPPGARVNLFLTGAAMFALSYGPAVGASYLWPDARGADDLRIPIAGPWLKLGQTRLCNADPEVTGCQDSVRVIGAIFAAIDGIAQAGSLLFFAEAIFMSTAPLTNTSYNDTRVSALRRRYRSNFQMSDTKSSAPALFEQGDFRLMATPYSDQQVDLGLSLSGTF